MNTHLCCPTERTPVRRQPATCTRKTRLCLCICAALAGQGALAADAEVTFDAHFLPDNNALSLARFARANVVTPGSYKVDVYLNQSWAGNSEVRFVAPSATASAVPCVDSTLLAQLNLRPSGLSEKTLAQLKDPAACLDIGTLIPQATLKFDLSRLRLDVSVPQAYLSQMPRDYVSPEYWDAGVPAALVNYTFNGYHNSVHGQGSDSAYLGLNSGLNLGLWHLRQNSTMTWLKPGGEQPTRREWNNIDTYVQRDLPALRSKLTLGDSYTDGAVFDSIGLRGVVLASNDSMLPAAERTYAPVVQGVAYTTAKVTVHQNGVLIYQTTVAPGPFSLNDLTPTGYGSNLDVTVLEADGRVRHFSVAYSSVAQLMHPGVTRYSVAVGRLRNESLSHEPDVAVGTIQHGFNNVVTGYAGAQGFQGYLAGLIGVAFNTPLGALALDLTQANARIPGYDSQSGQSVRVTFSKLLSATNTTLTVAAYRYSTKGFLSLADAAIARDYASRKQDAFTQYAPPGTENDDGAQGLLTPAQRAALDGGRYAAIQQVTGLQRQRSRFTLSLSQPLAEGWGALYANMSLADYWNRGGTDTQYQVGYGNNFHSVSYSLSALRTQQANGDWDNAVTLNVSVPLGTSPYAPSASLGLTHDKASGTQTQAMVNGTLGEDNQFNYGLAGMNSENGGTSGSLNAGYRSTYGQVNSSYAHGQDYSQGSVGLTGSVVAHPGGVTLGQSVSPDSAVAIVSAPGAGGARVSSASGTKLDPFGYAVVPYLTPYSMNTVSIDPKGLPLDVQLTDTTKKVAPYAGSVVMLKYKTDNGLSLIVQGTLQGGGVPPLGASVYDEKGKDLGVVGQGGVMLLRGVEEHGQITVRWQDKKGQDQSCHFGYQLDKQQNGQHYRQIKAQCLTSAGTH